MKVLVKQGRSFRVCSDSYFLMLSLNRCLCNVYMTLQLFPLQILKTYIGMCTLSVFRCLYFADDQHKYVSNPVMIYISCNFPPKEKLLEIIIQFLLGPGGWRRAEVRSVGTPPLKSSLCPLCLRGKVSLRTLNSTDGGALVGPELMICQSQTLPASAFEGLGRQI